MGSQEAPAELGVRIKQCEEGWMLEAAKSE